MRRAWPPAVEGLDVCPHRKLPIPYSALRREDGTGDFIVTDSKRVEACARYKLCGVCGKPLGYWIAFLGGPASADPEAGAYTDPPMHEACAEAALQLCPYIAHPRVQRRSPLAGVATAEPAGWMEDKNPDGWVMVITRGFRVKRERDQRTGDLIPLFRPAAGLRRERRFGYEGGRLAELTGGNAVTR
jgi:ferredoxin